ncbi:MAG: hypothetical protein ACK4S2_11935 [Gemmobacter sp.]|uniref:hypothetical protein n=1 Tax=Gemmobacter sp. TaxID=1898957 RepID=UPI00391BBFE3
MSWLNDLVGAGVAAIGLDPASRLGGSVQFFVYDVVKIFILLSVLILAVSYVQSHFPPERTRAMLGGRAWAPMCWRAWASGPRSTTGCRPT